MLNIRRPLRPEKGHFWFEAEERIAQDSPSLNRTSKRGERMKRKEFETIRKMLVAMIHELTSKALSLSEIRGIHLNLPDPSDVAALTSHRDFSLIVKERERELLGRLREALEQIDSGSYGICEECGEAIALKRLMARPTTSLCVECQSRREVHERRLRAASY
jgi:DnaK suppressor protein